MLCFEIPSNIKNSIFQESQFEAQKACAVHPIDYEKFKSVE